MLVLIRLIYTLILPCASGYIPAVHTYSSIDSYSLEKVYSRARPESREGRKFRGLGSGVKDEEARGFRIPRKERNHVAGNPLNTFTQDFNTNFLQTSNSGNSKIRTPQY